MRVGPVGELDLAVADRLQARLQELHEAGFRRFGLDLRRRSFIDSSGLSVIVRWDSHAHANGITFELIQGPRAVQRVFELVGITDYCRFASPDRRQRAASDKPVYRPRTFPREEAEGPRIAGPLWPAAGRLGTTARSCSQTN